MAPNPWFRQEGSPSPLGATYIAAEDAYNWALYSKSASAVTLLLYADDPAVPAKQVAFDPLRNRSGRIWHCRVPRLELNGTTYYAYAIDGRRSAGDFFDPTKVVLDPYAKAIFRPKGFDPGAATRPGSNAGRALLAKLPAAQPAFDWGDDTRPRHTHDLVVYEMHARGFTAHASSGVTAAKRGSFAAIIEKIPHLVELGVTAVELLPVYQFIPEPGGNYWGYMPINFFAPHDAYGSSENVGDEFRAMVKALHAADIEVILDVVYNHTAERGSEGPSLSYRAIDNSNYYIMQGPNLDQYFNIAGTGNVLRVAHPVVRDLIIDSMRYWVNEMHVDGFRFDLASILARDDDGNLNLADAAAISDISTDPDFANVRLIAEPWDLATYQLGRSFPGISWMQWNGRYRDDVRSFVKGDPGMIAPLMQRLYGSDDLFPDNGSEIYHPYQSVNFIDCHDGFCLYDLVAYNAKHNLPNGNGNRDGTDQNISWNCGWEGDDGAPIDTLKLRRRQVKNFFTLLLLSNGTPMFVMGDEMLQTQGGNNNPYNQDNETTWLDWARSASSADILRFFKGMIAFRKAHRTLGRSRFWREDVRWYGVTGAADLSPSSHSLAFYLRGASQQDVDLYALINAYWEPLTFTIQEPGPWRCAVDTSRESPQDIADPGAEIPLAGNSYETGPRSVVLFMH